MESDSFVKIMWKRWQHFGQLIGDLFARIVLTILFFTVLMPFGIGIRLFGDPLKMKSDDQATCWIEYSADAQNLTQSRRQF
ncbi:MAG: hypothetical protein CL606_03305 [Anaerolineaceae bacterium]|nr:hypothetical protein [Anaerolineaceae bacterium]|tara:strand:- start:2341 stop:2583 length:243 start_codon:yes stop_codon:yes gene_type:complete